MKEIDLDKLKANDNQDHYLFRDTDYSEIAFSSFVVLVFITVLMIILGLIGITTFFIVRYLI